MSDPIVFEAGQTGVSCYVRFDDSGNTAVDLAAGSGVKATRYTATAGDIESAGLSAGTYFPSIFAGTASGQSVSDVLLATVDAFHWSGTLEITSWAKILCTHLGCNNVLEVGTGQQYSTIGDAVNDAEAGDLVVVHAGTYDEDGIGKNGVAIWLAYGAFLNNTTGSGLFSSSVTDLRILGHARIYNGATGAIYEGSTANCEAIIECDEVTADSALPQLISSQTTGRIQFRARRIAINGDLALASAGIIEINADCIDQTFRLAETTSTGMITVNADNIVCALETPLAGSGGVIAVRGRLVLTDGSTVGLNAPSGVTVIDDAGAILVPDGRPTFSGSGVHLTSLAVARRD